MGRRRYSLHANVIGGGLAGSEAAWQLAQQGIAVTLWEMRPQTNTPVHQTAGLAELVCSNSLGSDLADRANGLLKAEMRKLRSLILACADETKIPAGGALAVDRQAFSSLVTQRIEAHPLIELHRGEAAKVPDGPVVVATGPLTSPPFAQALAELIGQEYLYFYDALAPIVTFESIDMEVAFWASRYGNENDAKGDYINCPLNKSQYHDFIAALATADKITLRQFESEDPHFFEGCLPIEVLAQRDPLALAFGPMRPTGLCEPRTGRRPFAVVQLRQDNAAGTLYNLVGFQTNLRWPEQLRVFRMIPGLERAEFVRLGQMHRNTFLSSPTLLRPTMQFIHRSNLFFAGQITGVEGYVGNAATGLIAGLNLARILRGEETVEFPRTTMMGALAHYVTSTDPKHFEPMKANFGLLPPLTEYAKSKAVRYRMYAERAIQSLDVFVADTTSHS